MPILNIGRNTAYVKYSVKPYTMDAYQRNCDNYIKLALGRRRTAVAGSLPQSHP